MVLCTLVKKLLEDLKVFFIHYSSSVYGRVLL